MIIDSLRNTESSIDMSDEYEGTLQTGQAPPSGGTSKAVDVVHKARHPGTLGEAREDDKNVDSMEFGTPSQDSDSDDSVDRGIEEAIQEYLKKKGDHKRKVEPTASPSPVPKHLKRECPFSDTPQDLDGNMILTASGNHIPKRNVVQVKMNQPLPLELSSRGSNYVEIKSRDLSKGGDKKYCTREREECMREGADLVREGYEECIDETGDESEGSPSASQRSRGKKQFPKLCLSTAIDPGESFRPYIILTSPERKLRYSRRSIRVEDQQKSKKKKLVKRKLQFHRYQSS
ncbi:hypothetical protein COCON_G00170710 [Conger conger]|uniref:Protein phosphatase 1 regulatory subunit 26 N-terminal domain-containing protein n=1 Tax=Conger conger TaxID=82655 RepID=A0A9Q1HUF0_CONCO|nr:hypothetical protein COCON_G00170710 [Conger conger]